jgi:hypothetical protein
LFLQLTQSERIIHLSSIFAECSDLLSGTNYLLLNELCVRPYHATSLVLFLSQPNSSNSNSSSVMQHFFVKAALIMTD